MTHFTLLRVVSIGALQLAAAGALHSSTLNTVSAEPNKPEQQEIIIDDNPLQTCFSPPCAFERYYDSNRVQGEPFHDSRASDTTYAGHAYWADTRPSRGIVYIDGGAKWRPFVGNAAQPGQYRVSAFIPRVATGSDDTRCASYIIKHAGGESTAQVNQRDNTAAWVTLGTFRFAGTASELVDLNWNVDNVTCDGGSSTILIDAMRFEPVDAQQPISVRAYLRDLPEGATVASGTTIWHCYSISRGAPIRWWWQNPSAGWRTIEEDNNGQGRCRESSPLEEPGIRRTRIEALSGVEVVATHETHFFVESAPPPTSTPRPATIPPLPTSTRTSPPPSATALPDVSVWIETGCDRTYDIGQTLGVGAQADTAGIIRLSFEPQGVEFAVRSVRAHEPERLDVVVQGPPGAQSIQAKLEVRNQVVATNSCPFRAQAATVSTPTSGPATPARVYLPYALAERMQAPTPPPSATTARMTATRTPIRSTPTPTRTATRTPTRAPTLDPLVISPSNVGRLEPVGDFTADMAWLETLDFSPSGRTLAWGGGGEDTAAAEVVDIADVVATGAIPDPRRMPHDATIHALEVFDDGMLYAGSAGGTLAAWEWTSERPLWRRAATGSDLAVKPDGTRLVSGGSLWTVTRSGLVDSRFLGFQTARPGGYSATGLIGLSDGGMVLYDESANLKFRKDLPTAAGWFSIVSFSRDGTLVSASDSEGSTHVWRTADGAEIMKSTGSGLTFGPALSPDGAVVATAFAEGAVTLRAVSDGRLLRTINAGLGETRAIQFAPNGRLLAVGYDGSGTADGKVIVWGLRD